MSTASPLRYDTVADLKAAPVSEGTVVLLVGKAAIGDGLGGFYRWSATDATDEEMTYLNVVASSVSSTGRWLRVFQRVRVLPHGVLVYNGGVRSFYYTGQTNPSGEVTVYLTMDGTATGAPIYSEIWLIDSEGTTSSADANDTIFGSRKSLSADKKTLVYRFTRGNSMTLGASLTAIAGLVIPGLRNAPAGVPIALRIDGV